MRITVLASLSFFALVAAACNSSSAAPPAAPTAAAIASAPPPAAAPSATPSSAPATTPGSAGSAATDVDPLVGKPAPDFTAAAQDGSTVHLAALKGKSVVVYFYPKDETPGCTKEACSFRDAWEALSKTGAVLVGVSADTLESHKQFVAHWKLPFLLASDPDGAIGKLFGVPFEGYHHRQTFVIGPDGNVRKVYRKVDVTQHAQQILDDLTHAS
jgi:thioredoxin-dependent peroxiredoxin